jgi:HD-GYP domain-containing protein (c-di-GMP phosphodiesterase class II)
MALVQHASIAIKNAFLYQSLQKAHLQTIIGLAEALETRDAYTRGHSDRAVEYAVAVSQMLGLTYEQADRLQYAVILHDIGKIGIPDSILNKPGKLTEEEFGLMKTHPVKGANILSKIPFLSRMAMVVRHHHERWDGTGYPDGLAGKDIPIESRIVAVLDSYEAMTSDRIYRKAPGSEYAQNELRRCAGTQFDPMVVEAFLKVVNDSAALNMK